MAKVSVNKRIQASPDKVWEMVSEWGGTHKWIPGVGPVQVEGEGVGSVRSADLDPSLGVEGRVSEVLELFDESAMRFRYRLTAGPLPVNDYVAEMEVRADGDASVVTWSSTWEPQGAPEQEIHDMLATLYDAALANVDKALT